MDLGTEGTGSQREALVGRMPVLGTERIYKSYFSQLMTWTSFEAATWAFLIGSYLPYVGNTAVGVVMFVVGFAVGLVIVDLVSNVPSTRYGIDNIDGSKSVFGTRGSALPLLGLTVMMVGWLIVLECLTTRLLGGIVQYLGNAGAPNEQLISWIGVCLVVVTWFLTVFGPKLFLHLSNWVAPGIMLVAVVMWILLLTRFGTHPFTASVDPQYYFASDKWVQVLIGAEFGLANAWTFYAMNGAISRLVLKQKHVIGPPILGMAFLAMGVLCGVAAFAAAEFGTADPVVWMEKIGGRGVGIAILIFIVIHNIAPLVVMAYIAGIGLQQIPALTRVKWPVIIAVLFAPGLVASFYTVFITTHVMQILSYTGVIFAAMVGIHFVDYYLLRHQQLDLRSIYCRNQVGDYYFWGGVNWIAVFAFGCGTVLDLFLLNPYTYAAGPGFGFIGSSIPTLLTAGLIYYVLMRTVAIPLGKGGYVGFATKGGETALNKEPLADSQITL